MRKSCLNGNGANHHFEWFSIVTLYRSNGCLSLTTSTTPTTPAEPAEMGIIRWLFMSLSDSKATCLTDEWLLSSVCSLMASKVTFTQKTLPTCETFVTGILSLTQLLESILPERDLDTLETPARTCEGGLLLRCYKSEGCRWEVHLSQQIPGVFHLTSDDALRQLGWPVTNQQ